MKRVLTRLASVLTLLAVTAISLFGCEGEGAGGTREDDLDTEAVDAVQRTTELGPVKAVVSLSPLEPKLGDPLALTLVVESDSGVTVEMPAFGEALGRFSIVDFAPSRSTSTGGKMV